MNNNNRKTLLTEIAEEQKPCYEHTKAALLPLLYEVQARDGTLCKLKEL